MKALIAWLAGYWRVLRRPSVHFSLGFLTLGGFIAGIVFPEQPPTIPHSIVGYRIDKDSNKCLSCHSRANSARTQAVMISITHYMDRDGQPLAAVSPRRYFCVQCHVPQQDVKPLVDNRFENIDQILEKEAANAARKP